MITPPFIVQILVADGTARWARRAPARLFLYFRQH